MKPDTYNLDIGDNHWLSWLAKDGQRAGVIIWHLQPDGELHAGSIYWQPNYSKATWTLESAPDEHLTVSPSIQCNCGDHGFIRDGRWVRA